MNSNVLNGDDYVKKGMFFIKLSASLVSVALLGGEEHQHHPL